MAVTLARDRGDSSGMRCLLAVLIVLALAASFTGVHASPFEDLGDGGGDGGGGGGGGGAAESVVARAGSRLTLSCRGRSSVGDPLLVSWVCRSCRGRSGQLTVAEYSQDGTVSLLVEPARLQLVRHSFQLVLDPARPVDTGTYVCLINNQPSAHRIRVLVQDVPGAPGRPLVTGFTSTAANISWAPSVNSRETPVHHYLVQVREGEAGAWGLLDATVTADNRTAQTVTGLRPYTVYSFRVLGVNELGQGAPSPQSYFMVTHRQLPGERPRLVAAQNASASSIRLSWRPPDSLDSMNGEFLGYQLTYRPAPDSPPDLPPDSPGSEPLSHPDSQPDLHMDTTDSSAESDPESETWQLADLHGTNVTSFVLENLEPFTRYQLRLRYQNMLGVGEPTEVTAWTDEAEPASPESLRAADIGDSWAVLTWHAPARPGARIVAYQLYVEAEASGAPTPTGRPVPASGPAPLTYNLTGLTAYTQYRVWVTAKSRQLEGRRSTTLHVRTDVTAPGAPRITNITCRGGDALYVHWRRPAAAGAPAPVDFYLVQYRRGGSGHFQELVIPTSASRPHETMFVPNLTQNALFEVRVVAGTNSLYHSSLTYHGVPSPSHQVYVRANCQLLQGAPLAAGSRWRLTAGTVAAISSSCAALLLAALAVTIWRRYFQAAYNHLDEQNKTPSVISTDWEQESPEGGAPGPVPVHLFPRHVARLHADGDIGFSKEYEAIQTQTIVDGHTSEYSQQPENRDKNRYLNIVAYDHTRVPLRPLPGQHRCDYVNANYVDGYERPRAYIGTQGPLPDTYAAFWRMCWEQDVHIVVMITNLVERGRKKCDRYWPQEGSETYGVVRVTAAGQDVMATYTIRKFKLTHLKLRRPRRPACKTLYQYHYTNWPDHGIPESPLPILSFVRKSAAANRDAAAPIVVHCSAGVGRTGTYIVLDSMMRMIRARGELNVFGFLKYIRTQRNFLVQTEEQYVFVHDALVEAIESGETDIHAGFLSRYLHNLQTTEQDIYPWYNLDRQFKLITYDRSTDFDMTSARHPANYRKNRSMELLPVEQYRVCVTPAPGVTGSDYVNASWLPGHCRQREFIVTQHPLVGTVAAFWQMVWDHNAQTVVLLSPVDDQEYCIFWPLEREQISNEQFRVRCAAESQQAGCVVRDFSLQSNSDDYELLVRVIQCSDWPLSCTPIVRVFDLVRLVQRHLLQYQNGPCLVVDRCGGTEAATFCCLTTLMKQLAFESHADVYTQARLYHCRRPGVWRSQDDYLYLYRAIEALVAADDPPPPPLASVASVHSSGVTSPAHAARAADVHPRPILKRTQASHPGSLLHGLNHQVGGGLPAEVFSAGAVSAQSQSQLIAGDSARSGVSAAGLCPAGLAEHPVCGSQSLAPPGGSHHHSTVSLHQSSMSLHQSPVSLHHSPVSLHQQGPISLNSGPVSLHQSLVSVHPSLVSIASYGQGDHVLRFPPDGKESTTLDMERYVNA